METNVVELPRSVGQLTKKECGRLLYEALEKSGIESQTELARRTGIPSGTLSGYFRGVYLPPQEKWNIIRKVFSPSDDSSEKIEMEDDTARHHSQKIRSLIFLLKDELNFFKDSSVKTREILKKYIDNEEAGYVITLFKALYNEEELKMWETFREGDF